MFCKNCGQQVDDFALACPKCGVATTSHTQAPPPPPPPQQYQQPVYQQPQYQQPQYQQPQYQQQYQQQYQAPVADVASGGIKFLSFCFPIVGLILYFVWKDQKPLTAKAIIKLAIIGFIVVNIIPVIIYVILFAAGVFTANSYGDYYSYYHIADFASRFFG